MFAGLIEEVGKVLWIRATDKGTQLEIAAPKIAKKIRTGDSVAANGCCLTLSGHRGEQLTFDLLQETLDRTNLKTLRRESLVNLERALALEGRVGGHFVQGHIDCVSPIVAFGGNRDRSSTRDPITGRVCSLRRLQRFDRRERDQSHCRGGFAGELCRLDHPSHKTSN